MAGKGTGTYLLYIHIVRLKEHCSQLISSNWESFTAADFLELGPELVYEMLKAKAKYPLHAAIQAQFSRHCASNIWLGDVS